MLLLPDVSEFQPDADLAGIKKLNGGGAILRACYGADHPDAPFSRHRAAASELGYGFTGLYQYLVAGQDAAAQARAFIALVGHLAPHEVAILDLEEGDGDQSGRAATWARIVDGSLGGTSWLYSGEEFARDHGLTRVFAGPRHTWVAAYRGTEPGLPHTLWQSTNGRVGSNITDWPGAGRCDTSLYHGTLTQLAALTRAGTPKAAAAAAGPREWTTAGRLSLRDLAAQHRTEVATILRLTAEHSPGAVFPGPVASYVNAVFAGQADPRKPAPGGLKLYLPG